MSKSSKSIAPAKKQRRTYLAYKMDILEARTHQFNRKINQLPIKPERISHITIDPVPVIQLCEEFYKFAVATLGDSPVYDQLPKEQQIQIEWNIITLDRMISSYVEKNLFEQTDGHSEFENIDDFASDVFLSEIKGHREFMTTLRKIEKDSENDPMRYNHIEKFPPRPKP